MNPNSAQNNAPPATTRAATTASKPTPRTGAPRATKATVKPAPIAAAKPDSQGANLNKIDKSARVKNVPLVRASFTIPEAEYELIVAMKKRCVAAGYAVKKSEVLRAAIIDFAAQSDAAITTAMRTLDVIKTGRPPKLRK